jgi:hypothetical protein
MMGCLTSFSEDDWSSAKRLRLIVGINDEDGGNTQKLGVACTREWEKQGRSTERVDNQRVRMTLLFSKKLKTERESDVVTKSFS